MAPSPPAAAEAKGTSARPSKIKKPFKDERQAARLQSEAALALSRAERPRLPPARSLPEVAIDDVLLRAIRIAEPNLPEASATSPFDRPAIKSRGHDGASRSLAVLWHAATKDDRAGIEALYRLL